MRSGRIVKAISGFYYVYSEGLVFSCRAKGLFRRLNQKPLVGDLVEFAVTDEKDMEGNIQSILPRTHELLRPAVANVDQALLIFAVKSPEPNFSLLDRFLIRMAISGIPVILCFNKIDLEGEEKIEKLREAYRNAGVKQLFASGKEGTHMDALFESLRGKTTVASGPSGVGKSTVVNVLQSAVHMETGNLSRRTERGKQTTRHIELLPLKEGEGFILDTPGFSSLNLPELEKEELESFYPEFADHREQCRFRGCSHIAEEKCGVKEAVERGEIPMLRYETYKTLYRELKERRIYS